MKFSTVLCIFLMLIVVAIAIPSFIKARNTTCRVYCVNNLRMIDSGKEQAALAKRWESGTPADSPSNKNIVNDYMKGSTTPECPEGGVYIYRPVGKNPMCTRQGMESPYGDPHRMPVGTGSEAK